MDPFWYLIIFSLLSCALPVSLTRRHLSQVPATDPSTFTPNGSPFFPAYSSSPSPPPPPPVPLPPPSPTFATFPANISALVLPRSPKSQATSKTLLIPVISAVLAVATVIGLALFLYGRWRGQTRHFKDESKSVASDISQPEQTPCSLPKNTTTENKLSVAPSTSDVLYLGNVGSSFVKPQSPEISPLPPLPARSFLQQHNSEANPLTDEEEEEDDFYSPLASVAGQETRIAPRKNPYSNCSCSLSSTSDSPAMSPSVTFSPPISSTAAPHWSTTQNPQSSPSPERRVRNNKKYAPSLRMFSLWNQNLGFPRISSASTSPERGAIRTPDAYARSSMYSSVSTTPDRFFRKVLESSPPRWNDFSRNVKSLLLSSTSVSPNRDFVLNVSESSRNLTSSWENPELDTTEQSESAPPPPQRPPPAMPQPPPLVPPSQSFMVQKSGKKLSFSELPQNCWEATTERPKLKLKPLPWDKVRPSSSRRTWDNLRFNSSNASSKQRSLSCDLPMLNQESRVLDLIKSQSIAFLLATLKLSTIDVCQALREGQYEALGVELLESLSRMAPSEEEERKLKSYSDNSAIKFAPSERFLKELLNVPFVFKRVDALLSAASFGTKVEHLKRSFSVIQAACEELRNSKILLKLLEAVLETGAKSRNAHDFKLETLLEPVDIKSLDGRTTLLHSVVQNIIASEGIKGLQVVGNLGSALVDVKKSAELDYGVLRSDVSKLYQGVQKISELLLLSGENGHSEEHQWWKFRESMTRFLETAAEEIKKIETKERLVLSSVKGITEYFHGDSAKEEAQVLRVFVIVRDFLSVLDKVSKEMEVTREDTTLA